MQQLPKQVFVRGPTGLHDVRAPAPNILDAVEEFFADDRFVQSLVGAVLAAHARDIAAVGGVEEHVADRVFAERPVLRRQRTLRVQPCSERAVGLLAGRVALEQLEHERRLLRIGNDGTGLRIAAIAPRDRTDEVALTRLLAQTGARPERERDGVVLVEHLVDRLREEHRRVVGIVAHRLCHRDDTDAEPVAQHLLVAASLDLVPREARRVVDEHDVEAALGRVNHQLLKLRTAVRLLPAGMEVAVLARQLEVVLDGELPDRLSLSVRREPLALLLGRLAHIGDSALQRRLRPHCRLPWPRLRDEAEASPEPPVDEPAREGDDLGVELRGSFVGITSSGIWTQRVVHETSVCGRCQAASRLPAGRS
ncbi:MAG TPA: hypothetical protein VII51_02875 [Gaiellaceae bacterium]